MLNQKCKNFSQNNNDILKNVTNKNIFEKEYKKYHFSYILYQNHPTISSFLKHERIDIIWQKFVKEGMHIRYGYPAG